MDEIQTAVEVVETGFAQLRAEGESIPAAAAETTLAIAVIIDADLGRFHNEDEEWAIIEALGILSGKLSVIADQREVGSASIN